MNSQYSKPSDQQHRIQVQSNIIYCLWMCDRAWAGTDAPFEVKTSLVGEGAEIKIRLMNDSGKTLEKKSDKIFANRYRGTVAVPSNVKLGDMLYLEIELPKHNLDIESDRVPAGPVIQARRLQWGQKEVRRGDTVKLQAEFIDLPDRTSAEVRIFEYYPDGYHDPVITLPAEIKGNRLEVRWEFVYPNIGMILMQSELEPYGKNYRAPEFFFVVEIDGTRIGTKQESGLLPFKDKVDIVLKDSDGKPVPDTECVITGPDGKEVKAKSDKHGRVLVKDFPPGPMLVRPEKKAEKG